LLLTTNLLATKAELMLLTMKVNLMSRMSVNYTTLDIISKWSSDKTPNRSGGDWSKPSSIWAWKKPFYDTLKYFSVLCTVCSWKRCTTSTPLESVCVFTDKAVFWVYYKAELTAEIL